MILIDPVSLLGVNKTTVHLINIRCIDLDDLILECINYRNLLKACDLGIEFKNYNGGCSFRQPDNLAYWDNNIAFHWGSVKSCCTVVLDEDKVLKADEAFRRKVERTYTDAVSIPYRKVKNGDVYIDLFRLGSYVKTIKVNDYIKTVPLARQKLLRKAILGGIEVLGGSR